MSSAGPLKVLIVDDSLLLRERLGCRLGRIDGVEIAGKASDVPSGISAFRRLEPDVVVLDIEMPGGCGLDVLDVIKRERPATRVIVLSNYPLPQFRKRSAEAGAEWFFDKTEESKRVTEVLQEIMEQRTASGQGQS